MFLDVFGVGYVLIAMLVAINCGFPGGPRIGCATAVGTDGKSRQELI
jgi:hypothetical protein